MRALSIAELGVTCVDVVLKNEDTVYVCGNPNKYGGNAGLQEGNKQPVCKRLHGKVDS